MPANPPTTVAEAIEAAARVADEMARWKLYNAEAALAARIAAAIRALAPGVSTSDGWRLVPVEMTMEMRQAAYSVNVIKNWSTGEHHHVDFNAAWSAALAAAPDALAASQAEVERLHERLEDNYAFDGDGNRIEMEPGSIPDGIECRDETIKLQNESIANLTEALAASLRREDALAGALRAWRDERPLHHHYTPAETELLRHANSAKTGEV